jgi:hypothetical protein
MANRGEFGAEVTMKRHHDTDIIGGNIRFKKDLPSGTGSVYIRGDIQHQRRLGDRSTDRSVTAGFKKRF